MSAILEKTFIQYQDGAFQPRMADLIAILCEIIFEFNTVYLVIDALDECYDLDEMLEILTDMQSWDNNRLHIIVTSRLLPEIVDTLSTLTATDIPVGDSLMDADILLYIKYRLETDRSLAKWPLDTRHLIQETLYNGAGGM